jgi:hypothetical protein
MNKISVAVLPKTVALETWYLSWDSNPEPRD